LNRTRAFQLKPSFDRENQTRVDMLPTLFPYNKQRMHREIIFGKGLITLKKPLSLL